MQKMMMMMMMMVMVFAAFADQDVILKSLNISSKSPPQESSQPPQIDGFCSPALSTAPSKRLQRPPLYGLR
jgi:hypothetical protein